MVFLCITETEHNSQKLDISSDTRHCVCAKRQISNDFFFWVCVRACTLNGLILLRFYVFDSRSFTSQTNEGCKGHRRFIEESGDLGFDYYTVPIHDCTVLMAQRRVLRNILQSNLMTSRGG